MADAGKVIIQIVAETGRAARALLEFATKTIGKTFGSVIRGVFERIGHTITDTFFRAFRNVGTAIREAIGQAAKFQTALAEVSTLGDYDMRRLRHRIEDLSMAIGEDLVGSTKAVYQALSAGISEEAVIPFTAQASRAAVAGLTSVETSVDALTSVLNAYRMEAERAGYVSDLFFKTIQLGKTRYEELAGTIGRIAPLAAATNVTLEEMFGALAALTQVGLKTEEAVTGLRGILVGLLKPGMDSASVLKSMGFEATRMNEAISERGLLAVLQRIGSEGMDAIKTVFEDVRGLNAALALMGDDIGQKTAETMNEMGNAAGATDEAFDKMASTFEKAIARMGAVWSTIKSELINPFIEVGGDIGNAIADWFTGKDFIPSQQAMATWQRNLFSSMADFSKGKIDADTFSEIIALNDMLLMSPGQKTIERLRMWSDKLAEQLKGEFQSAMEGRQTWKEAIKNSLDHIGLGKKELEEVFRPVKEKFVELGRLIGGAIVQGIAEKVRTEMTLVGRSLTTANSVWADPLGKAYNKGMQGVEGTLDWIANRLFPESAAVGGVTINVNGAGKSPSEIARETVRELNRMQRGSMAYQGAIP